MAERAAWRRWFTHRLVRPVEAALVHGLFVLFRALPLDRASAAGGAIARWLGPRLGLSRRARRNLERAFPGIEPARVEALVREMWDNLGRVAAEYPHLSRLRVFEPRAEIETRGLEYVDRARARGKPIIFFAAHLANWEIASLVATRYGVPVHLVYRAANNRWVDQLFREGRRDIAGGLIAKGPEGARVALARLKVGEHLGILADQKMNDGIPVPFFGRDAMTAPALAQFALRFDCTVLPAQVERLGGARFRVTVHPPLDIQRSDDRHADILATMTAVNVLIEDWVRQRPGQWLWVHRRWPD
ncbi:MAG: lipid A biosynthesis lauroyl acyltransferase [Rhodospirillales bacterium]|nr:lipid A biosynthesis lauroyl acyltransferase [Rhodospirillales bacterium]